MPRSWRILCLEYDCCAFLCLGPVPWLQTGIAGTQGGIPRPFTGILRSAFGIPSFLGSILFVQVTQVTEQNNKLHTFGSIKNGSVVRTPSSHECVTKQPLNVTTNFSGRLILRGQSRDFREVDFP